MLNIIYDRNTKKIKTFQYVITFISIFLISFAFTTNRLFYAIIGIAIVFNLPYLFHEKGIQLNKENNSYQFYNMIFGIKFFKSKKMTLPTFDYISLNKAQKIIRNPFGLNRPPEVFFVYEINCFDHQGNYTTLCNIESEDLENAQYCSKKLAQYFNIPLYDAVTEQPKWM